MGPYIPIGPLYPKVSTSTSYAKPTWRIALDHRFSPEVLAYVSFNHGYKTGGFNISDPTNIAIRPEELDAYEVGLKTDLLRKRLRLNASGFYYRYNNIQVARFSTGAIDFYNGAKATIYGFDLDGEAVLTPDIRLSGGLELLHDRFTDFPNAEISQPLATGGYAGTLGSANGNRLPFSQDATAQVTLDYRHDYVPGRVEANATYAYNTGWFTEPDNFLRQRPFSALNARLTYTPAGSSFPVAVWA